MAKYTMETVDKSEGNINLLKSVVSELKKCGLSEEKRRIKEVV